MSLTADDVREIMRLLEESPFDDLELETDGFKLTLRRNASGAVERATGASRNPSPMPEGDAASPVASPGGGKSGDERSVPSPANDPGVVDVPAPLLGVFYRAPKPGAEPFVNVGDRVEPDTVIAIVEVMKLMNSVRAGVEGEIIEIVAQNAAMVEFGETLIRVRIDT